MTSGLMVDGAIVLTEEETQFQATLNELTSPASFGTWTVSNVKHDWMLPIDRRPDTWVFALTARTSEDAKFLAETFLDAGIPARKLPFPDHLRVHIVPKDVFEISAETQAEVKTALQDYRNEQRALGNLNSVVRHFEGLDTQGAILHIARHHHEFEPNEAGLYLRIGHSHNDLATPWTKVLRQAGIDAKPTMLDGFALGVFVPRESFAAINPQTAARIIELGTTPRDIEVQPLGLARLAPITPADTLTA